ncbi:hypothetical protein [Nodularia sp. NIES-3585]|uniref:hypothetical protein n=1 Tax=Nodularia sp. NIES-3585 TaxID=1973477 RepID=UPI0015950F14|nr:hypothetical protein [Nodularia sp. NIES-3585]
MYPPFNYKCGFPGIDAYEQQYRDRKVKYLQKKPDTLGFNLVAQSTATECVS